MKSYKIMDKQEFCNGAQKKKVDRGRDRTTVEYRQITDRVTDKINLVQSKLQKSC